MGGYHSELGKKPFTQGFLSVWLDPSKPRHIALDEAIRLTNLALERKGCKIPIIQRVQRLRDIVHETLRLGEIVSLTYVQSVMNCTDGELDGCVRTAMQLYPEIKEVKLFDAYRYLYHASMGEDVLRAAMEMEENYIKVTQGRMNRVGHNWEACVEWFIDHFTSGADFLTQQHRSVMDPRRITIHPIKPVRGRRSNAEVDRV